MKKEKLKLNKLKVKSFTTTIENPEEMKGGVRFSKGPGNCPHTGLPTLDVAGCRTKTEHQFWCDQQTGYTNAATCGDPGGPEPVTTYVPSRPTCPDIAPL